ncbi:hypothetical protein [Adlercreutzia mucosicola]|uniref:hypothetical protein n=1 Tax=Adlercreutzia mucosicola TaxID=580026 RepID=UPI000685A2A7|nr:hypothetical protein [Adlercreutzia mucosicola]MCR2035204.1 hypothetical protein [Adlercreutzia mucosicola]
MVDKQRRRLVRALGVLGLCLAVVAAEPVFRALSGGDADVAPLFSGAAVADAALASSGDDAATAIDRALAGSAFGDGARRTASEAPPWFSEEVLSLEGVRDLRANEDWSVVGFSVSGDLDDALDQIRDQCEERGWTLVESGAVGSFTAVKEGGRVPWLLFSCIAVGEETCVVLQVPAA